MPGYSHYILTLEGFDLRGQAAAYPRRPQPITLEMNFSSLRSAFASLVGADHRYLDAALVEKEKLLFSFHHITILQPDRTLVARAFSSKQARLSPNLHFEGIYLQLMRRPAIFERHLGERVLHHLMKQEDTFCYFLQASGMGMDLKPMDGFLRLHQQLKKDMMAFSLEPQIKPLTLNRLITKATNQNRRNDPLIKKTGMRKH